MEAICCESAELLALLDAVGAAALPGVDARSLFPVSSAERWRQIDAGHGRLRERGFLRDAPGGLRIMDPELLRFVTVMAWPELLVTSTYHDAANIRRQFWHYLANDQVVELTSSAPGQYDLQQFCGRNALIERLAWIFLPADAAPDRHILPLPRTALDAARSCIAQGCSDEAALLLSAAGLSFEATVLLVDSIANPQFNGDITLLAGHAAHSPVIHRVQVLQGASAAWLCADDQDDPALLRLNRVDAIGLRLSLDAWFRELAGRLSERTV
jgi:hypothetical protein